MQSPRKSPKTNCTSAKSNKSNFSNNNKILSDKLKKRLWMIKQLSASLGDEPVVKVCSSSITECFICSLCNGYLYKATTITECLHTFCKSCIVKHFTYNLNCPKCNILIHPTDPFVNIRSDSTIQDLLYKLLPNVEKEERARESLFLEKVKCGEFPDIKDEPKEVHLMHQQKAKRKSSKEFKVDQKNFHIGFEINLLGCCCENVSVKPPLKAYFSMPLTSTVKDAQNFIEKNLEIPPGNQVNFFVCGYLINPLLGVDKLWDVFSDGDALESFLSLSYAIMPSKNYFEEARNHDSR